MTIGKAEAAFIDYAGSTSESTQIQNHILQGCDENYPSFARRVVAELPITPADLELYFTWLLEQTEKMDQEIADDDCGYCTQTTETK